MKFVPLSKTLSLSLRNPRSAPAFGLSSRLFVVVAVVTDRSFQISMHDLTVSCIENFPLSRSLRLPPALGR